MASGPTPCSIAASARTCCTEAPFGSPVYGDSRVWAAAQPGFVHLAGVVFIANVSSSNPYQSASVGLGGRCATGCCSGDPEHRSFIDRTADDCACRRLQAGPGRGWLRRQWQLRLGRPKRWPGRWFWRSRLPSRRRLRLWRPVRRTRRCPRRHGMPARPWLRIRPRISCLLGSALPLWSSRPVSMGGGASRFRQWPWPGPAFR